MQLMQDENRSYIFTPNEVSAEVTSQRHRGESDNDFNDRLIRLIASMYHDTIQGHVDSADQFQNCQMFFISNDVDNRVRSCI